MLHSCSALWPINSINPCKMSKNSYNCFNCNYIRPKAVGGKRQIKQRQLDEELVFSKSANHIAALFHTFSQSVLIIIAYCYQSRALMLGNDLLFQMRAQSMCHPTQTCWSTWIWIPPTQDNQFKVPGVNHRASTSVGFDRLSVIVWRTIKNGWIKIETHKQRDIGY